MYHHTLLDKSYLCAGLEKLGAILLRQSRFSGNALLYTYTISIGLA